MEMRFLSAADAGEWSRLRLEALQSDPEAFSSSAEEHKALSLDEIKKRLGSGAGDSFVAGAFEGDRLMGMAGFHRETGLKSRHKGRVWGVYVTGEKRGQGLGRALMEFVLKRARSINGVEQVLIAVTSTQLAASGLYRSLGFEPFGREPRALKIGDRFIEEDYMAMDVCCSAGDEREHKK